MTITDAMGQLFTGFNCTKMKSGETKPLLSTDDYSDCCKHKMSPCPFIMKRIIPALINLPEPQKLF